ncbi:MAG: glycerol-3-phosphate dehydrogenase [Proteobacteria bacterium]|nr:glycerol-3-phosphate dehydrogenase [Pseudomonadota bacterium]
MECDVLVVGGGINGCGIARDAAGRGLSVLLCEKDDLAAHTSSASSKLIHGGLRYLEHYEFRLVRKALIEREVLLRSAPHLIRPQRFVMPHDPAQRPRWMIRAGLFLYDHLARRELLPGSASLHLRSHVAGQALKAEYTHGFMYSDATVDDARLVLANALDARARGATILTRTRCVSLEKDGAVWRARLRGMDGQALTVRARSVVNAAGPWAAHFQHEAGHPGREKPVRLVKGSHIVVKRLFDHPHAYIFQNTDGRIVFAIPYERDFTLIGTTDIEFHADVDQAAIDADEIRYLCELSTRYFKQAITPADVVWTYSGVRPLVEDATHDAASVSRDYHVELDDNDKGPLLLSIFGGKLTTFRKLAEEALALLAPRLGNRAPAWTAHACLPGGDIVGATPSNRAVLEFDGFIHALQTRYAWLPPSLVTRYARAYGSATDKLLEHRHCLADMGEEILPGLFAAEATWWMRHEWALTAEDMLWRRSKLGLHLPAYAADVLHSWIAEQRA